MGPERVRLIGSEEEHPLQENRSVNDSLPSLAHPLNRGEEGDRIDIGKDVLQNLCGLKHSLLCGPRLVWKSRGWAMVIDERAVLGKLYQDAEGIHRVGEKEASGERPPGRVVNVRAEIELGGIILNVENSKGVLEGSNIETRIFVRRDIEKERSGRVRSAVMTLFIHLVDGFHPRGWWLGFRHNGWRLGFRHDG